jgi:ABC-type lipoprotein release transport system permease subunit
MIWFKLGWRNLWRNKRRTFIELASIGGSVFIGIWWNNLAIGSYDKMIDDGVRMGSGHIGIYHRSYLELRKTEQVIEADTLVAELERVPGVVNVFPRLYVPGLIRSSHESRAAGLEGIDFDREKGTNPVLASKRIVEGNLPTMDDTGGALIGMTLAKDLGLKVGNKFVIILQGSDGQIVSSLLRVAGITRTNIREIDAGVVMIDRKKLSNIIGYRNSAHEIAVILQGNKYVKRMLPQISEIAGKYPDATAYRWEDAMPALASSIHLDYAGLEITVIILYVIVGIGTINTLLMSVMERTREFGVIRAIGVKKPGILRMVLSEAFVLACLGVLIGIALGVIAGIYTSTKGINLSSVIDEQGLGGTLYEPIMISAWDVRGMSIMCLGMVCIALLASLYPAHHVMKIRPSDAMRIY